ncbi:MAG: ATP-binding cassette domain-containing protein [Fibromonadales bacterium]|nr:ATP-binding cassette domain-containing protein [Fibromonadales bacterium]
MESIAIRNLKFDYTVLAASLSYAVSMPKTLHILNGVNLFLQKGDILCITGKSGEGKSSLLRVIAGLERATSGSISLFGEPVKPSEWTALSMALKGIGFVFQNDALLSDLTVKDNIAVPLRYHKMGTEEEIEQKANRALLLMLASSFANEYPYSLSLGMRKRVAIARSWALDTKILLLDEPTAGLDKSSRINLLSLIDNLRELYKTTIVMVISDLQVARDLNSKISFLMDKKLTEPMYFDEIKQSNDPRLKAMVS